MIVCSGFPGHFLNSFGLRLACAGHNIIFGLYLFAWTQHVEIAHSTPRPKLIAPERGNSVLLKLVREIVALMV